MKLGLLLNQEEQPGIGPPRWSDLRSVAEAAEQAGFHSLWLVDHFLWRSDPWRRPEVDSEMGVLECWTTMAAVAAVTTRVQLGTLVTCAAYRHPALLAKMADTVEEISHGRLVLGLGAGDYEPEHQMLGQSFERRVDRFEEILQIIVPLLRTGSVDFEGEFYRARDFRLRPRGPRLGGPPILIGALAHRPRMLRLVARYADMWNIWAGGKYEAEEIAEIRDAVDAACRRHGRDPSTLRRTAMVAIAFEGDPMFRRHGVITGDSDQITKALNRFGRQGIDEIQIGLFPTTPETVTGLAPVVARVQHG